MCSGRGDIRCDLSGGKSDNIRFSANPVENHIHNRGQSSAAGICHRHQRLDRPPPSSRGFAGINILSLGLDRIPSGRSVTFLSLHLGRYSLRNFHRVACHRSVQSAYKIPTLRHVLFVWAGLKPQSFGHPVTVVRIRLSEMAHHLSLDFPGYILQRRYDVVDQVALLPRRKQTV